MMIEMRYLLLITLAILSIGIVRSELDEDRHDKDTYGKNADPSAPSTQPSPSPPTTSPTPAPSPDPCQVSSDGIVGETDGEEVVVSYRYALEYVPELFGGLQQLQYSVIDSIVPSFFAQCVEESRMRRLYEIDSLIGLRAFPTDSPSGETCATTVDGSTCIIVNGSITLYMDKKMRRLGMSFRDTQPAGDVVTTVTANIGYQMDNGVADYDEGIIRLEFLDADVGDRGDIAYERKDNVVVTATDEQPFNGTPFIISSSLVVLIGAFFTIRRRMKRGEQDDEELEKGSFADDDNDSDISFEEVKADELYHYEYPPDVTPEKTSLARLYYDTGDEVELCRIPSTFSR